MEHCLHLFIPGTPENLMLLAIIEQLRLQCWRPW